MRRFASFLAVGTLGFCVDAAVLTALANGASLNPYFARLFSFPAAVFATWTLNRRFTFASSARSAQDRAIEYGRYFTVQLLGAGANLVVYALCLFLWPQLVRWLVVPLAAGSAVGLIFNFAGSRLWVFPSRRMPSRR